MISSMLALVIAVLSVSRIVSETTPSYNSTSRGKNLPSFKMNKSEAFSFLRNTRQRRDLVEECWEGCYYGEVTDHLRWENESLKYITRVRCRSLVCPSGYKCTLASFRQSFYHLRQIYIQCRRN
ncbi:Hypothetical predicted protein [Mytilus galloprovincialis]|uniref:Uncharacterized protein n=1 Tax=Mytilus galloprovincialis TaxID=29158 RepID=A0A8B6GEI6_MYTGA|nr:Hypothetical predicted protein [Mytilus galloprovincialis]